MLARLVSNSWPCDPPTLASQSAGITGVSHHAEPEDMFLNVEKFNKYSLLFKIASSYTFTYYEEH